MNRTAQISKKVVLDKMAENRAMSATQTNKWRKIVISAIFDVFVLVARKRRQVFASLNSDVCDTAVGCYKNKYNCLKRNNRNANAYMFYHLYVYSQK